jgi:hypothetical protein
MASAPNSSPSWHGPWSASRRAKQFHDGQRTELLTFLARALERSIRAWLNLPE